MIFANVLNGNMPEYGLVRSIFLVDSKLYCLGYQPFQRRFDMNVVAHQVKVPNLAHTTELEEAENLVDLTSNYTISSKTELMLGMRSLYLDMRVLKITLLPLKYMFYRHVPCIWFIKTLMKSKVLIKTWQVTFA